MKRTVTWLALAAALVGGAAAPAQTRSPRETAPSPAPPPSGPARPPSAGPGGATGHGDSELDCRNCHIGKHRGVAQMYVGVGGRGTPMIPSHMFQVRVECVACHGTPASAAGAAAITGQTFRPSERACLGCHGEKYRGMLAQWGTTLEHMRQAIAPKLAAARAALGGDPKSPKLARARKLVEDAEFNVRFVGLAKGVHNVFYAADLLKLANGWLDEAIAASGAPAPKTDDQLVRGGYCAVLCHQVAGVKVLATATFQQRRFPHARHVTDFGATCTSCHSAETHKAVTATPATCRGCHHGPQNDRCETCHSAQAAFYRGTAHTPDAKIAPNLMADAVPCTGCHAFSGTHSREAVGKACLNCHDAPYVALLREWTTGYRNDVRRAAQAVRTAEAALAEAKRAGRAVREADALLRQARSALALVRGAGVAHNPLAADALLATARAKAEQARARVSAR
ncbi:MAG TPA: cytochrome c3 family protein [Methylomirabilota bacterium]|nr:cytochrome c3 family protein [Methylomirabilota bacterium]